MWYLLVRWLDKTPYDIYVVIVKNIAVQRNTFGIFNTITRISQRRCFVPVQDTQQSILTRRTWFQLRTIDNILITVELPSFYQTPLAKEIPNTQIHLSFSPNPSCRPFDELRERGWGIRLDLGPFCISVTRSGRVCVCGAGRVRDGNGEGIRELLDYFIKSN